MTDELISHAERYVIGALLRDVSVLREVQQEVVPRDFADMRLGDIYAGIIRMHAERLPVDWISVGDQLPAWNVRGIDLSDLNAWRSGVPTARNAGYYAGLVRDAALRRSLTAVGSRLQTSDVDPVVAIAEALGELTSLRDRDAAPVTTMKTLGEVLDVPETEDAYDWVIPDVLERRDRLMLTGSEGGGKALALDTPIVTPNGWTTMGALQVGDTVIGGDGKPTRVTAATGLMTDRRCYRMHFSDGSTIVADADHLWITDDYGSRPSRSKAQAEVRTTEQIRDTLFARSGHCLNHSISASAPLDLPGADLPLDPYVLGAWLGDGHTADGRITIGEEDRDEILASLAGAGWPAHSQSGKYLYGIRGLPANLRHLGVLGRKHIPTRYLRASTSQRLALLQGLMDTDGTIRAGGDGHGRGLGQARCEFSVTNRELAGDVFELILSMGIVATMRESDAKLNGHIVGRRWRIAFLTELPVFRLERKLARMSPLRTQRSRHRFITAVVPVESVPVRCIQVDNADHTYLAGWRMIRTHNSTFLRQLAVLAAAGIHPFRFSPIEPVRVLVVDAENSERQWRRAVRAMTDQCDLYGSSPRGRVALEFVPRIDITRANDLGALHRLADEARPDLMLIGPLYRLVPRSIKDDDDAAPVLSALDSLRERDVAMLIEAHAGHAQSVDKERDLRPRGSAALLGWPEFGLGLRREKQLLPGNRVAFSLVRWRGDRDARKWPQRLHRGQTWPWEPAVQL